MVYRKVEHNHTSDYEESENSEDTEANFKNLDSNLSVGRKRRKSEHKSYSDDSDPINNDCWDIPDTTTTQITPLIKILIYQLFQFMILIRTMMITGMMMLVRFKMILNLLIILNKSKKNLVTFLLL